jgi:tetratricopeptide (TPR) repeat protein
MKDDMDGMSAEELEGLMRRAELRLGELGRVSGRSLVDKLSGGANVELVALAVKRAGIRCRTLDGGEAVTLRAGGGPRLEAEAHILTVRPEKAWTYGRTVYLSGGIASIRLDVQDLGLEPLKLRDETLWDPAEEYWGDEPVMDCFKPVIAAGPRPSFEMEQILPGLDPDDPDSDPIGMAVDLYEKGKSEDAARVLHRCLEKDLRVLDAHSHLGNWVLGDGSRKLFVERALRNYQAGAAIGELSLGPAFRGLLPWNRIDNRPYLRCLHGMGLAHWALGNFKEAAVVFERMLWLNPSDNQGARFCLEEVAAGTAYEDSEL